MSDHVPEEGEVWFVRIPGRLALFEARVTDVTAKTFEIDYDDGDQNLSFWVAERYRRTDIEFVERKSAAPVGRARADGEVT